MEHIENWVEFGVAENIKTKYAEVISLAGSDYHRMKFWHNISAKYMSRSISEPEDRLPTLSAIAK